MRTVSIPTCSSLAVFVCLFGYIAQAGAASAPSVDNWATEVHSCFVQALDDERRSSGAAGTRYGVEASEIFLAEQIVAHLEANTSQLDSSQHFCEQKAKQFLSSAARALQEFDANKNGTLAKLGTAPISNSPFLVSTYQNLIGKHYRGHSDITAAALIASPNGFSKDARALIVSASQSPDLFRWNDDRFHAQTSDYPPYDREEKNRQLAESQARFQELLVRLISLVREFSEAGDIEAALGSIGIASHLMQDLTYHAGMTLTQHAGLSYAVKSDPDQPKPPTDRIRYEEAVKNTDWLLNVTLRSLRTNERNRILQWSPQGGFSYERLMRRIYGHDGGAVQQDISTSALIAYYRLAEEYSNGRRPLKELAKDSCSSSPGLACWSIQEIKSATEARLTRE